jgi:hypothetical protein
LSHRSLSLRGGCRNGGQVRRFGNTKVGRFPCGYQQLVAIELTNAQGLVKPSNGQQELVSKEAMCYRAPLSQERVLVELSPEETEVAAKASGQLRNVPS